MVAGFEVEALGVDLGQLLMRPLAGELDALFDGADGFEILFHFLAVFATEFAVQGLVVFHHQIEHACLAFQAGAHVVNTLVRIGSK